MQLINASMALDFTFSTTNEQLLEINFIRQFTEDFIWFLVLCHEILIIS